MRTPLEILSETELVAQRGALAQQLGLHALAGPDHVRRLQHPGHALQAYEKHAVIVGKDRIVAVDLLASLVMAGLVISGIASGNPFYLQSVLGFAVILFLGTVALARYLEQPGSAET